MNSLLVLMLSVGVAIGASAADIFLAGDSTCCDYKDPPRAGWGQMLQRRCRNGVTVYNLAACGLSSKSFRNTGKWDRLLKKIKPGDYVVIQFGHNDLDPANPVHYAAVGSVYRNNLKQDIAEVRARNGRPVIATSIAVRNYDEKSGGFTPYRPLAEYAAAALEVAAEEDVPAVDLFAVSNGKLAAMTPEETAKFFMVLSPGEYPDYKHDRRDNVHPRTRGAELIAEWFVTDVKSRKLPIAECFKQNGEKNEKAQLHVD